MEFKLKNRLDVTEDELFSELHHFLLRKNNRILSNDELVEKTGISSELIHKWVRSGKLKKAIFPNLGYPCERCGKTTNHGKICVGCSSVITGTLAQEEKDKEWFNLVNNKHHRKSSYHYK